MSDVSGIPNLGFGGGNFFAPQFSYNPQMSAGQASAAYMPAENYAQNVTNNLYGGGANEGFGRQTDYYSALGASYGRQVSSLSPYGVFGEGGGGGGASPYQTSPNVFDTGASPFLGGGGSSGLGGSIYGGGFGGGSSAPSMSDFQSPSNSYNAFQGGWGGVSNNLNLGAGGTPEWSTLFPSGGSSGTSPIDWSHLFGGGGGAKADPAPGMAMPGGLSSPMTFPQQQAQPQTDPYPNMAMPGGLGSPMTTPTASTEKPSSPFDTGAAPITGAEFAGAQGGGLGVGGLDWGGLQGATYQPPAEPNQYQTVGPQATDAFDRYYDVSSAADPRFASQAEGRPDVTGPSSGDTAGGNKSASALMEDARARLAALMGGTTPEQAAETTKAVETPTTADAEAIPLPRERPAEADAKAEAARPADKVDTSFAGRKEALDTLKKELQASNLVMTSSYRDPSDPLSRANPNSAHTQALAFDTRARTPEQADTAIAGIRELMNARGLVEGRDYKILDEVRSPSAWATGPHVHTQMTEQGMQQYQQSAYDVNAGQVIPRPPMSIPPSQGGVPLPSPRPAEADIPPERPQVLPEDVSRPPADIPDPRVSSGGFNAIDAAASDISKGGFNAIDAAAKHTGLELARANIDTPIEKIAMERGGQKAVDQVSSMAVGQTPRQLMQSYGGLFMSRAEPLFSSLGITRQDFEKAITMPPTQQDIKMRFGGGDFGPYPAYTGPETAPGGSYADFRQSPNVEDRRAELASLTNTEADPFWLYAPDEMQRAAAGEATPMARDLGIGDIKDYEAQKIAEEHQRLAASPSEESADLPLPGQGRDIPSSPEAPPTAPSASPFEPEVSAEPSRFAGVSPQDARDALAATFNERFTGEAAAPFGVPGSMPSSQDVLGYTPQQWPAEAYPASFNERFGGDAAAPEPATSMRDFQSPEQGYGSFQGAASPENRLEAQRAAFAASIRDNPEKSLQLAARLYSEDQNNPATRQAILETMLNAQQASGRDPLDPKYYPGNTQQYRAALAKLSSNNDLLNRVYQEMETPFSGSNRANYATDWASGGVAASERKYATPTWTSPSNEQFFLKDLGNDWTGQARAVQNQKWYERTTGRAR